MKTLITASIMVLLAAAVPAYATHEIEQPPASQEPADIHISWHEFRHDLGSYPGVTASINNQGLITLAGHTESTTEKSQLYNLAVRVRGATQVINLIGTD